MYLSRNYWLQNPLVNRTKQEKTSVVTFTTARTPFNVPIFLIRRAGFHEILKRSCIYTIKAIFPAPPPLGIVNPNRDCDRSKHLS